MRTSFVFLALAATALAAGYGCTLPLQGLAGDGSGGSGGTSATSAGGVPTTTSGVMTTTTTATATGTTTTSSSTSTTSTGPAECSTDVSCGTNGPCVTYTCVMGKCMKAIANDMMKVGMDTAGDCKQTVCMGGAAVTVPDLMDLSEDGNSCTQNGCDDNGPTVTLFQNGADCGAGQHCFNGQCLECGNANQCPQGADVCTAATCLDGTCGLLILSNGGSCGGGDECTQDGTCSAGQCVTQPKSNGTSCGFMGSGKCSVGACCSVVHALCSGGTDCCAVGAHCAGNNPNAPCTFIP